MTVNKKIPTDKEATRGSTTVLSINNAGAVHPLAMIYYKKYPAIEIQKFLLYKKIIYREGKSIKCLNAHTYGMVIGFFSSNKPIINPDITFDKIDPANTAAPARAGYKAKFSFAFSALKPS